MLTRREQFQVAGPDAGAPSAAVMEKISLRHWPVLLLPGPMIGSVSVEFSVPFTLARRPQPAATEPTEVRPLLVDLLPESISRRAGPDFEAPAEPPGTGSIFACALTPDGIGHHPRACCK